MKLVVIIEILLISTNYKQYETNFPYHVGLIVDSNQFCSGVILSKRYILTAARCLEDSMEADIIMGNPHLLQYGETVISWIFLKDPTNQIVLIQLPHELNFNKLINSINLPQNFWNYLEFVVTGWTEIVGGNQQLTSPLSHKIVENHEIINDPNQKCRFSTTIQNDKNIEDYGSPLVTTIAQYLIGIVILAEDSKIIYANISCYTEWIMAILQEFN